MRGSHKIIVILFLIYTFAAESVQSQTVPVPFDSTWYGFNTYISGQNYFLSYSKLVDLDNDGDSDVVASKYFSGQGGTGFVVLLNQGSGFYYLTPPVHYASLNASQYIETADVNNDGYQDVIVTNTGMIGEGTTISVFINQGNGTFGNPSNYTVGAGPSGIAAADFNNDGKIDLAVSNFGLDGSGNTISLLINNGSGSFNSALTFPAGSSPYRLAAGRINSDNLPDIVVSNTAGKVNVLLNSGGNNFSNRTEYSAGTTGQSLFSSIFLADMDNDNDLDVLYSCMGLMNSNGFVAALFTNQNGVLSAPQQIELNTFSSNPNDIKAADLNNDGWKDVVTTSTSARTSDGFQINLSNGSGGFLPAFIDPAGQNTNSIMIGDADNDGIPDILTTDSYSTQITVHKNFGNANFPNPRLFPTGNSVAGSVDAADIDNDGDLDVVVSASGGTAVGVTVRVFKNIGNGNFDQGTTYSIRSGGVQAKFRDLNNDNKPDLLFATAISSPPYDFHFAFNNGDGTFGAIQTKAIGGCGWYDIDAADFNNDGLNDVVLTEWLGCQNVSESARRIFVCLNQGNGVFSAPIIKLVGPHPAPMGIADFNRDGNLDIVTGVSGANLEINLGLGNGDFLPPVPYSIGSQGGAVDIVIADFNNDNKVDIASCNFFENYWVSILLGNGDGTFQPAQNLPTAYSPDLENVSGITVGDLDNDGDQDIIVSNDASRTLSLYYNNNGVFQYKMRAGAYNGFSSPVFGDFNNDGKGDVVGVGFIPPFGFFSDIVFIKGKNTGLTGVSGSGNNTPSAFILGQNYPNPFNPVTKINYDIPKTAAVKLTVYDLLGREVKTLINELKNPGRYEVTFDGSNLSSGVYFYRINADAFSDIRKMVLIK
jgi:hypothetical protein